MTWGDVTCACACAAVEPLRRPRKSCLHSSAWRPGLLDMVLDAQPLRAEPKKKRIVDPKREVLIRERLKKKLRKLEKSPPQLIPIDDFIVPTKYSNKARVRCAVEVTDEDDEQALVLHKAWSVYKIEQHTRERVQIHRILKAQQRALDELEIISESLHNQACKVDLNLFPFEHHGPSYTPPAPGYEPPDGKYVDITPKCVQE
uniref:large ribosomal subunit protein mL40 isoform X2 n=1 Tax=Myxine glutinosa TaxID=7769 RepID=UPI00358FC604